MNLSVIFYVADKPDVLKQNIMISATRWVDVLHSELDTQAKQGRR